MSYSCIIRDTQAVRSIKSDQPHRLRPTRCLEPINHDQVLLRKGKRSDLGKNLIPAQRRRLIYEYLQRQKVVRSASLSEVLGASEATVRRDLAWLERQGIAERTHGGAILSQRMPTEPAYASSALANPEAKHSIGRAASRLVQDGDTVFLNSGTTTTEVLLHLKGRSDLQNIIVVTNNVTAAIEARDAEFEVILLGGSFRSRSYSIVGHFAAEMLRGMHANKAFIGVDGISLKFHYTTPASHEAEIAHVMIEQTQGPVYVVADYSKWGVVSNFRLATLDEVDGLIVDDSLDPEARVELSNRGIEVIAAGPELEDTGTGGSSEGGSSSPPTSTALSARFASSSMPASSTKPMCSSWWETLSARWLFRSSEKGMGTIERPCRAGWNTSKPKPS